jgi:elongation factor 1-beta
MGKIIITLKIMPESPEVNLNQLKADADREIKDFCGHPSDKHEIEPVAFGLKALKLIFIADENLGGTENLEKSIARIAGVNSVEVIGLDRALG